MLAHASFQDRVILALRAPLEPGNGMPPLAIRVARISSKASTARKPPQLAKQALPKANAAPDWLDLQKNLNKQRERPGRIPLPTREEVVKRLGPDNPGAWQAAIRWSRATFGYQPELTDAWFDTTSAFGKEAGFDSVFSNSIFWVVTQSLQCFY
jgi:hypothetical protein